jgi:monoterpene epsilon-lactone hydrolase
VHAELERAIAAQRAYQALLATAKDLDDLRRFDAAEVPTWSGPLGEDVQVETADANGVPVEILTPPGASRERVIVYCHGGGLVLGSPETVRTPISRAARLAQARVVLPRYRLAPENPYPAAVEDVVAVYRWLLSTGVPAEGIVIAGESAGGGLVVAALLALRDAGDPLPAGGIPISPMVDFEFRGESWVTNAEKDGFVTRELAVQNVPAFLGDRNPADYSPVNKELAGLPPLLIQVGGSEGILDDARIFADKARTAGVDVTFEVWDEMVHLWHNFSYLPEAQQALERIGEWVEQKTSVTVGGRV